MNPSIVMIKIKNYLVFLALLFSIPAIAQKDRRAVLEIKGRVNELSISPTEAIWLTTAIGKAYHADQIDSNWQANKVVPYIKKQYSFGDPNFDRISFFNNDTAIISGYIDGKNDKDSKGGFYITKNAGKSWKLMDYGGDSWIYAMDIDKKGNAWMGGSSKEIYYSNDYGTNWTTLKAEFKSSSRTYGIHMLDGERGIIGSNANEILITDNNWKTSKSIQTPFDQKKYKVNDDGYSDNRISKIFLWGEYIVVKQKDHIYYANANKVEWQKFPIDIVNFELDRSAVKLYAITKSREAVVFSNPLNFKKLAKGKLDAYPLDLKVVKHNLFVLDSKYHIYKITSNEFKHTIPYTSNHKIPEPRNVQQFNTLKWGINNDQIYLSEKDKSDWYREDVLSFNVSSFQLLSDSIAIFWDGYQNNYKYALQNHKAVLYEPTEPLKEFLSHAVKSISINAGSAGCFHNNSTGIRYKKGNDNQLISTKSTIKDYDGKEEDSFKNEVSSAELNQVLKQINQQPSAIPSIEHFQITESDKKKYLSIVEKKPKRKATFLTKSDKISIEFYRSVLDRLDTIGESIISKILPPKENMWSTTSNWFGLSLINENQDTLHISRGYYVSANPWSLPWIIKYKGQHFSCYNPELSRFIKNCLPSNFQDKELFDNAYLILEIAHYLHKNESQ